MAANGVREELAKWLSDRGISCSGTVDELRARVNRTKLYPSLAEKLRNKHAKNIVFGSSLAVTDIPPPSAPWSADESLYPTVTSAMFFKYASQKIEASVGQQQKAYQLLTSRKIQSVKCYKESSDDSYVRACIKKSFGEVSRPAVVLFRQGHPLKAFCECAVGKSGLCSHVLSLLLFLKHYSDTKEKILALTCTEQLQKWHKRARKGSIPMVPLREIKIKSARCKQDIHKAKITPADCENSHSRRDVLEMRKKLKRN